MSKLLTTEEFIEKAKKVHGDKYDYGKVVYRGNKCKVVIICKKHGEFLQIPTNHVSKHNKNGCPKCNGGIKQTKEYFLEKAKKVHGDLYDYSKIYYKNYHTNIEIICNIHGSFYQTPGNHIHVRNSQGCPLCGIIKNAEGQKMGKKQFIEKGRIRFKNKFDYSKVNYINCDTKVVIICKKHGRFKQTPYYHLRSVYGCPQCRAFNFFSSSSSSLWLDKMRIDKKNRKKYIEIRGEKGYFVDGCDPKTKTVYEYNGIFWHGHPDYYNPNDINPVSGVTFGELYRRTLKKEKDLKKAGYTVVVKWENPTYMKKRRTNDC